MPIISANGIDIYYEEEGRGPPVVLIHGHSVDRRLWDPQVPALVAAGYRVIRYDVRGHGLSSAPPTGYTWENYTLDLKGLLDALKVGPAALVGLSMGGAIALHFALTFPQQTAAVVAIDSALPGYHYSQELSGIISALVRAVRQEGARQALQRYWLPSPLFDGLRRFPDRFRLLERMVLEFPAADYQDQTLYAPAALTERLGEVKAPTLVLVGELDMLDFHLIADILAENIPGARKEVIAGAGHVANLEQPEAVNAALLRFLGQVLGGGSWGR